MTSGDAFDVAWDPIIPNNNKKGGKKHSKSKEYSPNKTALVRLFQKVQF